jgi:SAM-dependent methyltransferase
MYAKIYQKLVVLTRPIRHGFPNLLKKGKIALGYDFTQWQRIVMYREIFKFLKTINLSELDALEISSGVEWQKLGFRTFSEVKYPEFDICFDTQGMTDHYDIIIADQVFEHLLYPYRAGKNIFSMLKPGGYFIITTPFLIRVHNCPVIGDKLRL